MAQPNLLQQLAKGNQLAPTPPGGSPAPTGQIQPFRGRLTNPADVQSVRTIGPKQVTGPTAQPNMAQRGIGSRVAGGLAKGGILGAAITPNTMGDATLSGAGMLPADAPERPSPDHFWVMGEWRTIDDGEPSTPAPDNLGPQMDRLGDTPMDFTRPTGPSSSPSVSPEIPSTPSVTAPANIQPEASFTMPDGSVRDILPNMPVSESFPENDSRQQPLIGGEPLQTDKPDIQGADGTGFQRPPEGMVKAMGPDGKMVFTTPEQAAQMNQSYMESNAAPQMSEEDRREVSSRLLRGVINDPDAVAYDRASAERQARIGENFGEARGPDSRDRDRRGTMSMEAATRMTGGDRDAARAMIERQRQGMGEFEEPEDNRTPEQIENERLRNERLRQIIQQGNQPDASPVQKRRAEFEERMQALQEEFPDVTQEEIDARRKAFLTGDRYDPGGKSSSPLDEALGTGGAGQSTGGTQKGGSTPPASTKTVRMKHPNGGTREVPQNDVEAALAAGYTKV